VQAIIFCSCGLLTHCCYLLIYVEVIRRRRRWRHRELALVAARHLLTSQSGTKTSPIDFESTDYDTASSSARTAGHHRRSQRKSLKSVFASTVYKPRLFFKNFTVAAYIAGRLMCGRFQKSTHYTLHAAACLDQHLIMISSPTVLRNHCLCSRVATPPHPPSLSLSLCLCMHGVSFQWQSTALQYVAASTARTG